MKEYLIFAAVARGAPATGLGRQARESVDRHSPGRRTAHRPGGGQGNALAQGTGPVQVGLNDLENQMLVIPPGNSQ